MIGQSGLPTMNNLAGANEKKTDDTPAKSSAGEAGAFERILRPEAQTIADAPDAKTPAEQLRDGRGSSFSDAEALENEIAQTQVDPVSLVELQIKNPSEREPEVDEQRNGNIADDLNARQGSDIGVQILRAATTKNAAEPRSLDVETTTGQQSPIVAGSNTQAEVLDETSDRAGVSTSGRSEIANASLAQSETILPPGSVGTNDQLGSATPQIGATEAKTPGSIDLSESAEIRRSQQVSSSLERGSEAAAAVNSKGAASADAANLRAEAIALNTPASAAEKTGPVEVERNGLTTFGDLRSTAAMARAFSAPDPNPASQNVYSISPDGSGPKSLVTTPTINVQTVTPEAALLAQSASADLSEVLLAPSATVASTTAPRLDAPSVAPAPISTDAKLVIQQINQAIIRMDGARTEVTLDPVELGRVSLTFITKDDGVTVLINADRSETADLLRRNGEQLQRDLSNAGYEDVDLEFSEKDDAQAKSPAADRFDDNGSTQSLSVSYDANFATSGLDIRI